MGESEVNITYQTLFELLRRESSREELQELDNHFFKDLVEYVKEKRDSIAKQRSKEDLFAEEEGKKAGLEFESIRKTIKKLYEKRESKIVNMALDCSRTEGSIVDTSAMLPEEKELYDRMVAGLDLFRQGVLLKVVDGKNPIMKISQVAEPEESDEKEEESSEPSESKPEKQVEPESMEEKPEEDAAKEAAELIDVRFTESMPSFVGEDFNEYGPFEAGDTAKLPPQITDILINKGVIEKT